ncbi:TlyA family rRNA (cytidine-2'-O)-methyltransferase [soil metagenome]
MRLDIELVRRGLARSREQAVDLIATGRVTVSGQVAVKAATAVAADTPVVVRPLRDGPDYVSRGGQKLAGALDELPVPVAGRRCLDAGASTGGFTDVLLRRGAREVLAVDVGYGLIAWSLRTDDRVRVMDRRNVRHLSVEDIGGPVDLITADLSFISLTLVLAALSDLGAQGGDMLLMVKPQFAVGRDRIGQGGVVRDPLLRAAAVASVGAAAAELGWGAAGVTASSLPGPAGNVEYFLWLRRDAPRLSGDHVRHAVENGPQ